MTMSGSRLKLLLLVPPALLAISFRPACGGNLEMVEKNVEELETVNDEALRQIPRLPRDGSIDLKAYVTLEDGKSRIRIEERGTTVKGSAAGEKGGKGGEVSAPSIEERIDFLEKNGTPATKAAPGGKNVR